MNPPLNPNLTRIMLLVALCMVFGLAVTHAQNVDNDPQKIEQEIERLQKIRSLQQEIQKLQEPTKTSEKNEEGARNERGRGGSEEDERGVRDVASEGSQTVPPSRGMQSQMNGTQNLQNQVSFQPVDTGRSAVSFYLGGDSVYDVFAFKINLLYAATMTPNLGLEVGLGERTSIGLGAGYNKWGNLWDYSVTGPEWDQTNIYKRKFDHLYGKIEFRYWFRHRFEGHFVGVNAFGAEYNIAELGLKPIFDKTLEQEGFAVGGGLTYGYVLELGPRWGMEFTLGVGAAVLEHDQRTIGITEGEITPGKVETIRKTYVGPTSAGITILFKL